MGETNKNKFGTEMKIVEHGNWYNTTIEFQDEHRFRRNVCYGDFKLGKVRNPYDRILYGEGFLGEGAPTRVDKIEVPAYRIWRDIIRRCYSSERRPRQGSYKNCIVSESWKNYSNFYKWYNNHIYQCRDKLQLDKDLLSNGKKIYSEETCMIVPYKINRFCVMSKVIGATYTKNKKWRSRICTTELGIFDKKEDAQRMYLKEKNRLFYELVEDYQSELPTDVYNKLKEVRLVE